MKDRGIYFICLCGPCTIDGTQLRLLDKEQNSPLADRIQEYHVMENTEIAALFVVAVPILSVVFGSSFSTAVIIVQPRLSSLVLSTRSSLL